MMKCFPHYNNVADRRERIRENALVYSCFEKGCLQYEENLNATMPKVIMVNGGFTVA